MKKLDLKDKRFGRLLVLYDDGKRDNDGRVFWNCLCDCGNETEVRSTHLKRGEVKSCGCMQRESNLSHGMHKEKIYRTWASMKSRVFNTKNKRYLDYGGRGITVCDEWLKFENFFNDMGKPPSENHQIDRINNDGNYEVSNCRWVTASQNMSNRRRSKKSRNKYRGVSITKCGKYNAGITKNYKRYNLGNFEKEKDAALAYNAKAKELHGEFAMLNEI